MEFLDDHVELDEAGRIWDVWAIRRGTDPCEKLTTGISGRSSRAAPREASPMPRDLSYEMDAFVRRTPSELWWAHLRRLERRLWDRTCMARSANKRIVLRRQFGFARAYRRWLNEDPFCEPDVVSPMWQVEKGRRVF